MLSEESVREYRNICADHSLDLTDEEAREQAEALLRLYIAVYSNDFSFPELKRKNIRSNSKR